MFNKIQKWYNQGLWTAEMVQQAYTKGVLTSGELSQILNTSASTENK